MAICRFHNKLPNGMIKGGFTLTDHVGFPGLRASLGQTEDLRILASAMLQSFMILLQTH